MAAGRPQRDVDMDSDSPSSPSSSAKKRKAANADLPELEVDLSLPEPPSKRARRAIKKGKPLPPKPQSDDEREEDDEQGDAPDKGKEMGNGVGGKKERSQFGIWIGNLPFTVTRPQLFKWLIESSGGAIDEADITRVNLPLGKKQPHQQRPHNVHNDSAAVAAAPNKGFAYVDFATYEAQVAAAALSETELGGRRVLIKDSKSFEGRPKEISNGEARTPRAAGEGVDGEEGGEGGGGVANGKSRSAPPGSAGTASTKIFVGNLGFDTTEDDLRRHFAPCGPVAWVKVATFPDNTDKCRGYGWVQFGGETEEGTTVTPEAAGAAAAAAVKGFARIKEVVDTEEDFAAEAAASAPPPAGGDEADVDDEAAEREASNAVAAAAKSPAHTKTRKWWVNKLKGRPLKIQFAEDDRVRYKKRFGKDRSQSQKAPRPREDKRRGGNDAEDHADSTDGTGKQYKYQDLSIAQRTGAVTASLGKKTILE